MGLPYFWKCFLLFLIQGFVSASDIIEIHTTIHAHYAITTVKAPFATLVADNSTKIVSFEMNLLPEAFVSGFSVIANELQCDAIVKNLSLVEDESNLGITSLWSEGDIQVFRSDVMIEEDMEGFFLLKYEHPVLKDNFHNNYNMTIPVQTSNFYKNWNVTINIVEDYEINTISHDMQLFNNDEDISREFQQDAQNRGGNHILVSFEGSLTAHTNTSGAYKGFFSVIYTTDHGVRHMETFVSEKQIAVVISQNAILNSELSGEDWVALIDVSGSMRRENKLSTAKQTLKEEAIDFMREQDNLTIVTFNGNATILGTYDGSSTGKKNIEDVVKNKVVQTNGGTNIEVALISTIKLAKDHREKLKSKPIIILITDGRATNGETDEQKILTEIQSSASTCIPIHSFAIGSDAAHPFLQKITGSCGVHQYHRSKSFDKDMLRSFVQNAITSVYANDPEISYFSYCVDDNRVRNDLNEVQGKIYVNAGIKLINIPFRTDISKNQLCEVSIIFKAIVGEKNIVEEQKICFVQEGKGKMKYQKFTHLTSKCSENTEEHVKDSAEERFLNQLRYYKDITDSETSNVSFNSVIATKAKFVVKDLTALVVNKSNSEMCKKILSHYFFLVK